MKYTFAHLPFNYTASLHFLVLSLYQIWNANTNTLCQTWNVNKNPFSLHGTKAGFDLFARHFILRVHKIWTRCSQIVLEGKGKKGGGRETRKKETHVKLSCVWVVNCQNDMNDAIMISTLHASMLHLMPIVITFVSGNAHGESQAFIKNWCRTQNYMIQYARYRGCLRPNVNQICWRNKRDKRRRGKRERRRKKTNNR